MLKQSFLNSSRLLARPNPRLCLCSLILCMASAGCFGGTKSPARVAIQGEVTLDGEPLENGIVKFIPVGETKGPVAVVPVEGGIYKCPSSVGPMAGVYRVEIDAGLDDNLGEMAANPKALLQHLKNGGAPVSKSPVPKKYNRQSILMAEVAMNGERTFDFELETANAEDAHR